MLVKAAFSRILTAILSCILIGVPILGFAGLKHFLLQHGVFEDECRAGINGGQGWEGIGGQGIEGIGEPIIEQTRLLTPPILLQPLEPPRSTNPDPKYGMICMDRMVKFDSLISLGLLASAVATLVAYFVLNYIGHVCGSITGCLLVAGGVYVLSVPSTEQVFDTIDRYFWGFLLLSLGSPFVVVSSMDAASVVQRKPMLMLFTLFAALELGSGFWTYWCYLFNPQTTDELFNQYLAVPCVLVLMNLAIAPLANSQTPTPAGNIERLLERVAVPIHKSRRDHLSAAAEFIWEPSDCPKMGILLDQMSTLWFWLFALYYVVNIMTFDLYYSSGLEYTWILDGVDVSYQFLYIRPLLSALTALVVYVMVVYVKITTIESFFLVSSLTLFIQVLELTRSWRLVALFIGPARVALVSLGLGFTLRIFGPGSFGIIYSAVMILSGISDLFLPELASWTRSSGADFIHVMGVVCVSTLLIALFMIWRLYAESREIQRELLKREATAAEEHARQVPDLV